MNRKSKASVMLAVALASKAAAAWLNAFSPQRRHHTFFLPASKILRAAAEDRNTVPWLSDNDSPEIEDRGLPDREEDLGDVQIPSTGISVMDDLEAARKDRFTTELVPITGLTEVAAQLVTTATSGSFEVVRYIVALSPPDQFEHQIDQEHGTLKQVHGGTVRSFVMVDIPPYSAKLAAAIRAYIGPSSRLVAALITSRDAIHYDDAPAVFTTRRSDLIKWSDAFPALNIVGYRLDIPRDCRESITQQLDGYGPFALHEQAESSNITFVETGRPLTFMEWDYDVAQAVLAKGTPPPDDNEESAQQRQDDDKYSPAAIRSREQGKRILAVYTPGHSFGSVSYVFPETKICCAGFTIPVEDTRGEDGYGLEGAGPAFDCRGYITTSKAGLTRQMESARELVSRYADRFNVVFPSRGDPLFLDGDVEERQKNVYSILDQFEKIGRIYDQLGITSLDKDDAI